MARPPLFTKSVAIFWFRSFALNEQQAISASILFLWASGSCNCLPSAFVHKLVEIFDFSSSSPRQAKHFEKHTPPRLVQITWEILLTSFCLERFRDIMVHYWGCCMAFLKAKRREKDLARDTSSEVTTICSNLFYIFTLFQQLQSHITSAQ